MAGHAFRAPALTDDEARGVARRVREVAREARRERTVDQVIEGVGRAASELADRETEAGREAAATLRAELGWPDSLVQETLEGMAAGWDPGSLDRIVRRELNDRRVLDGFVAERAPDGGERERRASGPPLLFQVQAGNVPGVGVTGLIRGLLVRSGVLAKTAREEPGLAGIFARNLRRRDPLLGRTLGVTWWPGGSGPPAFRIWSEAADRAVVYGGAEAVSGLRRTLPPRCELVVYGPKVGVGAVLPDADLPRAAASLARDVCAYEQRGCVSPRLVCVMPDSRRLAFAEALHEALGDHVKKHGRAPLGRGTAAAIRAIRAEVELGGHGDDARVLGDPDEIGWTVLTSPRPRLERDPLPRVVRVFGSADVNAMGDALSPLEGHVQAVGYAGEAGLRDLAARAVRLGACRVAPFGTVAWPPADWRHDGRHQLLPLLRWTELERPG